MLYNIRLLTIYLKKGGVYDLPYCKNDLLGVGMENR